MNRRKGFTLIELLVVVAIIALLISILLPSLSRAREITKRAVCASNIRGIGQGMKVYSNDNYDWYPTSLYTNQGIGGGTNQHGVNFVGTMGNMLTERTQSSGGAPWDQVHPSRSMFMLVTDGTCTTKQYICPSSGDSEDDLRNVVGDQDVAAQPGINRYDFRGYPYVSYGMQLPFGPKAKPNENLDARMVIMSDKGPYFTAGSNGNPNWSTPDSDAEAPGGNGNNPITIENVNNTNEDELLQLETERWKDHNSGNHGGEGQNCLYQDGHATFEKKPIVGVNFDNIYTVNGTGAGSNAYNLYESLVGVQPGDLYGPYTNTDAVIVP